MPTKLVYVCHDQLMSDSVFMKTDIQTDYCVSDKWNLIIVLVTNGPCVPGSVQCIQKVNCAAVEG